MLGAGIIGTVGRDSTAPPFGALRTLCPEMVAGEMLVELAGGTAIVLRGSCVD